MGVLLEEKEMGVGPDRGHRAQPPREGNAPEVLLNRDSPRAATQR